MLRHHSDFLALYYKNIFPKFSETPLDDTLTQFFAADGSAAAGPLALDVQQRFQNSERYTQYLKDEGLFVACETPEGAKGLPVDQGGPDRKIATEYQPPSGHIMHLPCTLPAPASPPAVSAVPALRHEGLKFLWNILYNFISCLHFFLHLLNFAKLVFYLLLDLRNLLQSFVDNKHGDVAESSSEAVKMLYLSI